MSLFSKFVAPLVLALGLAGTSATAAILVTVDVSDPSAVTFTGTGERPIVRDSTTAFEGFTLLDFLTGPSSIFGAFDPASSFQARGARPAFDNIFFPGGSGWDDLNIYNFGGGDINLRPRNRAFRGILTADLSAITNLLPGAGTFGQIILGDVPDAQRRAVGAYEVVGVAPVPLPLPGLLLVGAIGAMAATRKRKASKPAAA